MSESREEHLARLRADRRPGPKLASERARPTRTSRSAAELPGTFEAVFSGHCQNCNLGFPAGSRIRRTEDGAYVHAGCADR